MPGYYDEIEVGLVVTLGVTAVDDRALEDFLKCICCLKNKLDIRLLQVFDRYKVFLTQCTHFVVMNSE